LACSIAACGSVATTQSTGQGIHGVALAGPACPGPIREGSPCPDRPVSVTIDVYSAGLVEKLGSVRSDAQGRFTVDVDAPGDFVLQVSTDAGSPLPTGPPTNVHVDAGAYTQVTMHLDTGIR
jgi:hypothetical protein